MKKNTITKAIGKYFKTTTLHGFKYLASKFYYDRVGWALGCLASAGCAGVLCVVLWQRFLLVPALLQLRDLLDLEEDGFETNPTVAICQPPDVVMVNFLKNIKTNGADTSRLPTTLANALQGKETEESQIDLLQGLLQLNNMSLTEMLQRYTSDCSQLTRKCRWLNVPVNCSLLFKKRPTLWGVCCVATPDRFSNITIPAIHRFHEIKKLDVALQCSQDTANIEGCEVFTRYVGEEWSVPTRLSPGFNYMAQLTFHSEKDNSIETLLYEGTCISSPNYFRSHCLVKCMEKKCGCTDPLRRIDRKKNEIILPGCPLKRLPCLRGNTTCKCFPACQKTITKLILESGPFHSVENSLDPIYDGINISKSVVLWLRINIKLSKLFMLKPTETWFTLLSSLGGVFNMFLGVGLFSALEFLFFVFVKLPITIRRTTEIVPTASITFYQVG